MIARITSCLLLLVLAAKAPAQEAPTTAPVAKLRTAAGKAIQRIQESQVAWYRKESCTSCHHQLLPAMAFKLARERAVPYDETVARDVTRKSFSLLQDLDNA